MKKIEEILIQPSSPVRAAIEAIDRSRKLGVALVTDGDRKLINTITDGDVRRGLLKGINLDSPVSALLEIKKFMPHPLPVVAHDETSNSERLRLMRENAVRQLPILDAAGRVKDLVSLHEIEEGSSSFPPIGAVVMAGGMGKRLMPLTEHTPKPMLPIGGRPLMEILVGKLSEAGIRDLHVTTHYKAERIVEHFGDGGNFGVNISYVNEPSPLGTAGALGLLPRPTTDLLVVTGDVLTHLDFAKMVDFHRQHGAMMTVAVRAYEHVVPFGVVRIENSHVVGIDEKPAHAWYVSAGIYILSPAVFDELQSGERLDMPDLISRIIAQGKPVVSFPIREKWIDIGRHGDYELANQEAQIT